MKIAALYDIHGNLPALNAVLEELKEVQPDLIIIGGDIVSGPMPDQTLNRLSQLGDQVRFIRGNADREVVMTFDGQSLNRHYLPAMAEKGLEEIRWVAQQLTQSERDFLATLPEQLVFQIEDWRSILFCHATPHSDEELFTPLTPEGQLDIIFSGIDQEIVVCGHTHIQFEHQVGNLRILNAGSVGIPFADQPGAYWLLLGPQGYEFRQTMYDGQAAAQEIRASGHPQAQEFVEENVFQVRSAAGMMEMFERLAQAYKSEER